MPLIAQSNPIAARSSKKTRVAIVDDDAQVRLLLRVLLRATPSVVVVAEADDGEHAAQTVVDARADLVIMDYEMARVDGVQATREILAARPTAQVVVFSGNGDDEVVAAGFRAAGAGVQFDKTQIRELVEFVAGRVSRLTAERRDRQHAIAA